MIIIFIVMVNQLTRSQLENQTLSIRIRQEGDLGIMNLSDLPARMQQAINTKITI